MNRNWPNIDFFPSWVFKNSKGPFENKLSPHMNIWTYTIVNDIIKHKKPENLDIKLEQGKKLN